jgi:hypothetical protein
MACTCRTFTGTHSIAWRTATTAKRHPPRGQQARTMLRNCAFRMADKSREMATTTSRWAPRPTRHQVWFRRDGPVTTITAAAAPARVTCGDLWVPKTRSGHVDLGFRAGVIGAVRTLRGSRRGAFLPSCPAADRPVGTARAHGSFQRSRDPRVAPPTRGAAPPELTSTFRTRRPRHPHRARP